MRNLADVLTEMIKVVPKEMGDQFNHILDGKIPWTPPESMGFVWGEVQNIISRNLPEDPKDLNEWQKKALKIWTGKDF